MKKLLCILFALVMLLILPACTVEDAPSKETAPTQAQQSTEKKDETFALNETAAFKALKFTATELKESDGDDFFTPATGNVFVGIKFTIENISDEEQSVSSLLLFDAYADDIKCDYSFSAACAFDEGTLDGSVAPGKKLVGWYAMEVPSNWKCLELNVQTTLLSNNSATFVFEK